MASDSNLIRASFGLGQARAAADVPNMQELYKSQADLAMKPFETIMGFMGEMKKKDKALDLAKSKQLQPLKNAFDGMYQSLYAQKEPLPQSFIDAIEGQVTMLQDEFETVNTIGEGDTRENERARSRIMGEFTKLKNSVVNFRGNLMQISGAIENLDGLNVEDENIEPLTYAAQIKMWDEYVAKGDMAYDFKDGVVNLSIKNYRTGTMFVNPLFSKETKDYQYGDTITLNLGQMQDMLPQKDKNLDALILENMNNAKTSGVDSAKKEGATKGGYTYDIDTAKSKYNTALNNEQQLDYAMRNAVDAVGGNSFYEDLLTSDLINKEVLNQMGFDSKIFASLNKNNDKVINKEDAEGLSEEDKQMWDNNVRTIRDAITNRNSKTGNYNFELSKELFVYWQTDKERQKHERNYDKNHKYLNPGDYSKLDDQDPYRVYTEVPSVSKSGDFIKISPQNQQITYDNIQNKTKAFQGAQGYYVRLKAKNNETMFLRYDSYEDYLKDKNSGNYSIAESSWEKTFGKDSVWGVNRYIPQSRLIEIEAAYKGVPKSR